MIRLRRLVTGAASALAIIAATGSVAGLGIMLPESAMAAPLPVPGSPASKAAVHAPAVSAAAISGTALAATQAAAPQAVPAASYTCVGNPVSYCIAHVFSGAILYKSSGGTENLSSNEAIRITCYYKGNSSSDGYWDHVTREGTSGTTIGHVDDGYVNFNHHTPDQLHLKTC